MVRFGKFAVLALALLAAACPALAEAEAPSSQPSVSAPHLEKGLAIMGICAGTGLVVFGGGKSISMIGSNAVESIARQPEAAGSMFLSWLLTAAMIEGATLFGLVICYMAIGAIKGF